MREDRVPEELEFQLHDSEEHELNDELLLTPSPEEEKIASGDLILEAESIKKTPEITFDDEAESEDRIRKAMEDYDASMNEAADCP